MQEEPLTAEVRDFILKWKDIPGSLIMVLHRVQEHYGYIPRNIAFEVANLLEIPLAKVYGVVTFYNFFKLKKPGKHRISVCMGTACYLKGGEAIVKELGDLLGAEINATTKDGEFSLQAVRCLGCCGLAPVLTVDGDVYGNVKTEDLAAILATYRGR